MVAAARSVHTQTFASPLTFKPTGNGRRLVVLKTDAVAGRFGAAEAAATLNADNMAEPRLLKSACTLTPLDSLVLAAVEERRPSAR